MPYVGDWNSEFMDDVCPLIRLKASFEVVQISNLSIASNQNSLCVEGVMIAKRVSS